MLSLLSVLATTHELETDVVSHGAAQIIAMSKDDKELGPTKWKSLVGRGLSVAFIVALASCGAGTPSSQKEPGTQAAHSPASATSHDFARLRSLEAERLNLRAPAVDVPLRLDIPVLEVSALVMGVGLTTTDVMDAPLGEPEDPVWQKTFWYRGGGVPGDPGTATIAGHVSGGQGPSVFFDLHELQKDDVIHVVDMRDGTKIQFTVTESRIYSVEESEDPAVLERVYGSGPVAGTDPIPSSDGRSYLTLITCAGSLVEGSYDKRLVVFSTRTA